MSSNLLHLITSTSSSESARSRAVIKDSWPFKFCCLVKKNKNNNVKIISSLFAPFFLFLRKLRDVLQQRIIRFLLDQSKKEPEKYARFFEDYGLFMREGIVTSAEQDIKVRETTNWAFHPYPMTRTQISGRKWVGGWMDAYTDHSQIIFLHGVPGKSKFSHGAPLKMFY